ncbi:MAG: hypothetical protein AB1782_12715 [Cyanobacteriota bacterium]
MLSDLITKSAKFALEKPAPFLRYTTFVIYLISMAAQGCGIVINKDIPKKEKNFLLLQELVNGALELATFMTIATGFENWGKKLAEKGIITGTQIGKNAATFNKGVTMLFSIIGTVLAFNLVTPLLRNPIINMIQKISGKKTSPEKQDLTKPVLPTLQVSPAIKYNANNPFANFEQTIRTNKIPPRIQAYRQPTFTSGGMRV